MNEKEKLIDNSKFLLSDLISGDESIAKRPEFEGLSLLDIKDTLKLVLNDPTKNEAEKKQLLSNLWRIHYRQKPPTIEEFLGPEWIGPTAISIFPQVRDTLSKFWSPTSQYRHLLLAPAIGWGKSVCSAVSILYTMVQLNLMRNPKQFFNLAQASAIVAVLGSFTQAKAKQTLLKPFFEILQTSSRFRKVRSEDRIAIAQREEDSMKSGRITWSTASLMDGALQFSNDLTIFIVSNLNALLGLNIITGALSEISFFLGQGVSAEAIDQMYHDLKGRIFSRFTERYFATTVLDSSPNSFDSPIDKYIFSGEAEKDPLNLVVTSSHWAVHPSKYPKWQKTGETFPIFRGSGGKPPLILLEDQVKDYSPTEIYNTPIDLKNLAEHDTVKIVKDYCGWPSESYDKLITNFEYIEQMFSNQLKNIYTYIQAPANKNPERLIWDQIVNQFFIMIDTNFYEFYRAPNEKRFIHIDLAESGDIAGISMVHPEIDFHGQIVIVTDFTIGIIPGKDRINILAIEYFLKDLRRLGRMGIELTTYDRYQSSESRQNLERDFLFKDKVGLFSVDIDTAPYYSYVSWIKNGRIKSGRNINLKNNLKSLQETTNDNGRKKIDHLIGKLTYDDGADWITSTMGQNAKDISDSHCGACFHAINYCSNGYIPKYQWQEDNKADIGNDKAKEKILTSIYNKYSFLVRED